MIKGIDVSYCQTGFDFAAAKKAGCEFVIVRAGIGTRTDTQLKNHMKNITKNNLKYGFYWYSKALTVTAAKDEASACIKAIKNYSPDYPVFYDMEEQEQIEKLDNTARTAIITAFCEAIKVAGFKPGIYLNPSWLETYVDKTTLLKKYPLWLAHWTGSPDKPSKYDYGQTIWQWGVDNIGGMDVDGDVICETATKSAETVTVTKGRQLKLTNTGLYASAFAKAPIRYLSGTYYCYDSLTINGMTRICPALKNIGGTPLSQNVTGFVKLTDLKL